MGSRDRALLDLTDSSLSVHNNEETARVYSWQNWGGRKILDTTQMPIIELRIETGKSNARTQITNKQW